MTDTAVSLALVGRLFRHRWLVFLVVAVLGAALGFGSSFVLSPGYVSTGKILLGGERDSKQLPGEVQIATSLVVLDKVAATLGGADTGADLQHRVTASVEGNVITISGAAPAPASAQQLAQEAIKQYIDFSTQIVSDAATAAADASTASRAAVQKRIDDANARLTTLLASPAANSPGPEGNAARVQIDQEKASVTQASKDLEQIDTATQTATLTASMGRSTTRVIELPVVPDGQASPTQIELIAGGAVLAIVLAVLAHLIAMRSDRRLREPNDVAAALGAPVLGQFEIDAPAVRQSLLDGLLHDDRRWAYPRGAVTDDERSRVARGERVLRRLAGDDKVARVVVLCFDDDPAARSAVPALAVAATRLGPVTVVTSDETLGDSVRTTAASEGLSGLVTVGTEAVAGSGVLRCLSVPVERPMLPESVSGPEGDAPILLATTAGRRTGWELAAIVGACSDMGRQLAGCVVVTPRRRDKSSAPAGSDRSDKSAKSAERKAMASSA